MVLSFSAHRRVARHAKAALDMAANKTDANDADGLAQLAEVGFFREVRVKGFDSMLTRSLVAARTRLVRITTELSNQIRGVMKRFALLVPAGKGSTFLPVLEAWRGIRVRAAELGRQLVRDARQSPACRFVMSIPGMGAITQPPLPQPLRSLTTSGSPDPSARGSA